MPQSLIVLSLFALPLLSACGHAGQRLLHIEIECPDAMTFTGLRGVPDDTPVEQMWDVLDEVPLEVVDEYAGSVGDSETVHTMTGSVTVRIKHVDNILGEASLSSLTLFRPDGESPWRLSETEVDSIKSQVKPE